MNKPTVADIVEMPDEKITHEDGTGHNCDAKGCPICWDDGYNQAIATISALPVEEASVEDIAEEIRVSAGWFVKHECNKIIQALRKDFIIIRRK